MSTINGGNYRQLVATSGAALSHTGNTSETALVSVPIPPLGPRDRIVCVLTWAYTNSANIKNLRVRYHTAAGTSGTQVCISAPTTTSQTQILNGQNRAATNSQIWGPGGGTTTASGIAGAATTLDTTAVTYLNITATLADAGETITLDSYLIEIVRG